MKTFKVSITGTPTKTIGEYMARYSDKPVTNSQIFALDDDIRFIVCDLNEAHGNLNRQSREAWLCSKDSGATFNISITF